MASETWAGQEEEMREWLAPVRAAKSLQILDPSSATFQQLESKDLSFSYDYRIVPNSSDNRDTSFVLPQFAERLFFLPQIGCHSAFR